MTNLYPDDSMTLHTDAYQINMIQTYYEQGIADKRAVFEVFSETCRLKTVTRYLLAWNTLFIISKSTFFPNRY